ncbi:hypothetical protein [Xanthomonas sacchari]|uniref:hypothetical protein n=1 Tax=Xanthomonas sacchari TaxID=56458 RepID=UPI003526E333
MNDLADELDPQYRSWLLSQGVPQVWAATFSFHLDKGEGTAIARADAVASVVKGSITVIVVTPGAESRLPIGSAAGQPLLLVNDEAVGL